MGTDETIQQIKLRIKKYLELENVSVLAGAGASFHLGAPIKRVHLFFYPFLCDVNLIPRDVFLCYPVLQKCENYFE